MPSWNFRGGKSLGGGGGESYGFVREGKGLFSMWRCVLSQNFCWASYKLLLPLTLNYCQLYCNACRNASRLQHKLSNYLFKEPS